MFKKFLNLLRKISSIENSVNSLMQTGLGKSELSILQAKLLIELNNSKKYISSLSDIEFKVFSQFGDDGIIQFLINRLSISKKTFIEFGVENYTESNTRFLLLNNCWSGLIIDGHKKNIEYVEKDSISWSNQIFSKSAFVTRENINSLLSNLPFDKEIGILSIDIDGNDYWIWEEIDVVNPIIVIIEYNSLFGQDNSWVIPYSESFVRGSIDSDDISFYGASLGAFKFLANKKGYTFLGCNSNGNNSYFVRNDYFSKISDVFLTLSPQFELCSFNEIFKNGKRIMGVDRILTLNGRTVINVVTGENEVINFNKNYILNDHYRK